ncbi:hypothetical protein C474_00415 [Halogeometricum pallidum JCM 14848]|uniref:Uncharacterized protein n=1 Tax=Halogeometricum pallidum JCM 14848 TaxID=1227487 RepID=M0DLS3_HALPD|nr:hypothetical protein [Halogeometricum pallidum]ELZ35089.1 hypothetical protein C474_00415 [Halogeometricum pallidum JCM 14848]
MADLSARVRVVAAALLVLLALVAPAYGVLALGDVSAAEFQSSTTGSTATASTTTNGSDPVVANATLVVRAPDSVRPHLEQSLSESFAEHGFDVTVASEIPDDGSPVLVVAVDSWNARWNPATPSATIEWRAAFDANGHEEHVAAALANDPIRFDSRNGSDVVAAGDYRLDDRGTGLVSRPAYDRHLVAAVSEETARRMLDAIPREAA